MLLNTAVLIPQYSCNCYYQSTFISNHMKASEIGSLFWRWNSGGERVFVMLSSPAFRQRNDCYQVLRLHTQVTAFFLYEEKCLPGKCDEDWMMCAPKTVSPAQCKSSFPGSPTLRHSKIPELPTSEVSGLCILSSSSSPTMTE